LANVFCFKGLNASGKRIDIFIFNLIAIFKKPFLKASLKGCQIFIAINSSFMKKSDQSNQLKLKE
jgi:hypothetical protein